MYYLIVLSLTVQNVLNNEYFYPYPQLYDQQSNEYYKDPISVQNLRYKNKGPPQPEANPIKVQYDAVVDEVHTKYLNSPKQIYKQDRYKPLDAKMQKLKLIIGDPKTSKKKIILSGEIVKTYNKYKDVEHNDYEPNAYIERLKEIYSDHRTPKKYKNIYLEIISTYYRNRDLLERTYKTDSEEYESEKDLNDYDTDILSKRNPRTFVKWLGAWFSKFDNSSTITPAPPTAKLSQLPQKRDTNTSKQLFIAPTTEQPFTDNLKETETLKNITEVLQKLNLNIEKQNKLAAIIFQNLYYSRIAQQHNMNIDRKRHIRFKRELNSENAKESTVTNSTLKTKVTEDISKKCNCSEAKDGCRVVRADRMEVIRRSDFKTSLMSYIKDLLEEMESKIEPLPKIKEGFLENNVYEIGYIIANIDTLIVNVNKLKANAKDPKQYMEDKEVFDVFDKVTKANDYITNFMKKLQLYTKFQETNMTQPDIQKELHQLGLPKPPLVFI